VTEHHRSPGTSWPEVTALGYGTTGLSVGQRVFGITDWYRDGTLAEYVAVEARNLAPLPGDVDFTVGASLPISGVTAWQGLFEHGRLRAGQSVLVHGAAGAVGSMVTQLAREAGAYVIGTGRAADRQTVLDFGAQEFVDLDNDSLEDFGKVDLVFDVIGGDVGKRSAGLIRGGGTLVSIVGPTEARPADGLAVDFVVESDRAQLSEIVQRVRDGRLRTNIGNVSSFDDAVAAFNQAKRIKGKTIIRVRPRIPEPRRVARGSRRLANTRPHSSSSYQPEHERQNQEPEDRPACPPKKFVDFREIGTEHPARNSEGGAPHNGPDEVGEKKQTDIHSRYTGGNRNHSANTGQKLAEGYLEERFSGEASVRALDIPPAKQSPFAIALDPLLEPFFAQRVTRVVKRKAAEHRADGTGGDDSEQRQPAAHCLESGERHDQLGGNRENDVLQRHQKCDSPVIEGGDEMDYPIEHGVNEASLGPFTRAALPTK
jgi:NADPH:quinone reductase-like Zn-dependent oxidoreductase